MAVDLKPMQALDLWRNVLIKTVRGGGPDLSARQLAIVLTVYMTPPPHTVRGLAALLDISKPAITRALDRLGILGLARRKRDEDDRRSVLVQRTVKGSVFLRDFAEAVSATGRQLDGETETSPSPDAPSSAGAPISGPFIHDTPGPGWTL
jgi:DNA-binding MarR family transcriptional regulator